METRSSCDLVSFANVAFLKNEPTYLITVNLSFWACPDISKSLRSADGWLVWWVFSLSHGSVYWSD